MSRFPQRTGVTSRLRLRGYDYATPGYYFLTVCIQDRTHRLGTVIGGVFHPSPAGVMADTLWQTIANRFPSAALDRYCVMPNHIRAIVGVGTDDNHRPPFPSIAAIMDWFKSETTVEYIRGVKQYGWPAFTKRVWLDGYHDHVIRNERDLDRIRAYIESNAVNWQKDGFYGP